MQYCPVSPCSASIRFARPAAMDARRYHRFYSNDGHCPCCGDYLRNVPPPLGPRFRMRPAPSRAPAASARVCAKSGACSPREPSGNFSAFCSVISFFGFLLSPGVHCEV